MIMRTTNLVGQKCHIYDETQPSTSITETLNVTRLLDEVACGTIIMVSITHANSKDHAQQIPPAIQSALKQSEDIFKEPTTVPPPRFCDHSIPLPSNAKIINQRSYRLLQPILFPSNISQEKGWFLEAWH